MIDTRILLLTKCHILSTKLYDFLKRDYKVSVLNMDDVLKDRVRQYSASFYGIDQIIFTTEFIWEIFSSVDNTATTKFFSRLFSISSSENIKITYIAITTLFNLEFLQLTDDNDFSKLSNYVRSAVEASKKNCVINVPSIYGISSEADIIELIQSEKIQLQSLAELEAPLLADNVALYISENIHSVGTLAFPRKKVKFLDWIKQAKELVNEDFIIRFHQEHCVFDLVYRKEASSHYRNQSIAKKRIEIGRKLSEIIPLNIRDKLDFVSPVPRTGLYYAMGLSEGLNIPYRQALIKETYSERSFSLTNADDRKKFLWKKLIPIPELVEGKTVAVVDEAIFTGTTLKVVCEMLWNCNVKEIYLCIPTPPCRFHCNYMVHPPRKMLLEYMSQEYLKEYFNVSDIFFQDEKFFMDFNKKLDCNVCLECFYGVNNYE